MEINHLRAFFEVAKSGQFSDAAKRLHLSQSALSRSVALLEESEGVQLFTRSKRGVELTAVGSEVFERCRQLFQTVHEIEGICRGRREVCEGPLRFATSDHVTNDLLVPSLQSFRKLFPKVVPSVFTGSPDQIFDHLLRTECEFALLFTKPDFPQVEYKVLRREPMALVCAPDLWRKHRGKSEADTLKKVLREVGYVASIGASLQTQPTRVMEELFGEMPPIGVETNNQEAQKRICLGGGGVAYLARFMVAEDIAAGRLHEIPVKYRHEFNLWIALKKGRALSLAARNFLEHCAPQKD